MHSAAEAARTPLLGVAGGPAWPRRVTRVTAAAVVQATAAAAVAGTAQLGAAAAAVAEAAAVAAAETPKACLPQEFPHLPYPAAKKESDALFSEKKKKDKADDDNN